MDAVGIDTVEPGVPGGGGRARRRWRRAGAAVAIVAAISVVSGAAGVWAATTFSDVPESHPFAEEIGAVADACLAGGYPDGTYRPSQDVTRQAMAAFLARTGSDVAFNEDLGSHLFGSGTLITPSEKVVDLEVEVPDLPGCSQWVVLQGQLQVYALSERAGHCIVVEFDQTCRAIVNLEQRVGVDTFNLTASVASLRADYPEQTVDVFTAIEVGPGTHVFSLSVGGYQIGSDAAYYAGGRLMATVVPFGHTGAAGAP